MTNQGRSLDDLPLAAYTTGVVDDEPDEESVAEQSHLSQQEAIALAMGIEPAAVVEPAPAAAREGRGLPRLSLPRLSLPRPSLPRLSLPRLGWRGRAVAAAESPFQVPAPPLAMPVAHATTSTLPSMRKSTGIPGRTGRVELGDIGAKLRDPRTAVRDPRVLFGGVIAVGVVLLGISMLGGNAGGGAGPGASASVPPGAAAPTTPGPATILLSGEVESTFTLTGSAGFGRPTDGQLGSTWGDGAGSALSLSGRVGSGTRTTTADLVLAVTVMLGGRPVTFTSQAGECTIGMAEKVFNVTGSFVCPEVTSDDGKVTLKITGNYQT